VTEPGQTCERCGGSGWVITLQEGREVAARCWCRKTRALEAQLAASKIPARYRHCTIESFELWNPKDPTLNEARNRTREWVDCYPGVERGLVFMGKVGTGKTHLAVAALQELITTKGARGLYVNSLELVQQLQMAIEGGSPSREEILSAVTETELVVVDELGAGKLTEWVRDLLYYVVNTRYMSKRTTIFTTNYLDAPQLLTRPNASRGGLELVAAEAGGGSGERWQESLADRISDRLRSRLYEMCDVIKLYGDDFRARRGKRGGRPL
jgi:DNA replication protein DnaC